ncbi:MAG TPA: dihydropteroate synthase [Candidatus Tenderia electrophaga]|uniref:Dihydropteroate synthase n=1 Tax=Candidatus Tenderia electrophaga TaxID=1748243 RepID=A0A832J4H1_9GAMM|nr:dihydropteroate synthase [Candidatus Tenderia electrophaga]
MGVVNVTPDSFSDGGRFVGLDHALTHVEQMLNDGVDIVDVGGESTRPGAIAVSEQDEIERVVPLVEAVRHRFDVPISVDTSKPGVMRATVAAGANMLNDVRALQEEGALLAAAELAVPVCLMHMQGKPRSMQEDPRYDDVTMDVLQFLKGRIDVCQKAGIARNKLLVDPGFGFGKSLSHNLTLLRELDRFKSLELPILIGVSRKSMIGTVLDKPVDQRLYGSLAAASLALWQGASVIRAHDVAATKDVVKLCQAVLGVGLLD